MSLDSLGLRASHYGLHPLKNEFSCPLVYHERYSFADWPENHTFPMDKFARIAHAVQHTIIPMDGDDPNNNIHPRPLVRQEQDFFRPLDLKDVPVDDWLCSIIDPDFVHRFLNSQLTLEEARYIGFREQTPRPELIERTVLEVAGTVLTAQLAYHFGIAANVAGGTHHAHPEGGAGYTILNDLAVTANFLTNERLHGGSTPGIERVLVIDCDVHQGDGTAKFSTLWNDDRLATLSLHCASNYPQQKANSTYDIGLRDKCQDEEYLQVLKESVNRAISEIQPDFVLYDAGVDVYEKDKLGRLRITEDGIRQRDYWVLNRCVSLGIPVAAVGTSAVIQMVSFFATAKLTCLLMCPFFQSVGVMTKTSMRWLVDMPLSMKKAPVCGESIACGKNKTPFLNTNTLVLASIMVMPSFYSFSWYGQNTSCDGHLSSFIISLQQVDYWDLPNT
jgi:acetoin utilization deacetylase AcuC-like enzyme